MSSHVGSDLENFSYSLGSSGVEKCHSRISGNPGLSTFWIPAYAGMTESYESLTPMLFI